MVSENYRKISVVPRKKQSATTRRTNRFMLVRERAGIFLRIIYNTLRGKKGMFVMLKVVHIITTRFKKGKNICQLLRTRVSWATLGRLSDKISTSKY